VFQDGLRSTLPAGGLALRRLTREQIRRELDVLDRQAVELERGIRHFHCCGGRPPGALLREWRAIQDAMIRLEKMTPAREREKSLKT
jgi:hypothetical protein